MADYPSQKVEDKNIEHICILSELAESFDLPGYCDYDPENLDRPRHKLVFEGSGVGSTPHAHNIFIQNNL